jgi:(p)ppGpp synthase/HD superfamily hydrolase
MNSRVQLTDWVRQKHEDQLIRRTAIPYFRHLVFVAQTVSTATTLGYEIGLCHDLLEDTTTTVAELRTTLQNFGYGETDAGQITACVVELTDVYTKKAYPDTSKTNRKEREAKRLTTISSLAQTVKYADLIDNIKWVLKHDTGNAVTYLQKKQILLYLMDKGDHRLHAQALALIDRTLGKLIVI